MRRRRLNPFYAVLGIVGFLFTVTASSYCLFVLRGVRHAGENSAEPPHAFEQLMDRHGTSILVGQLLVLAGATVGAVAVDHADGKREIARRQTAAGTNTSDPGQAPPATGVSSR